MKTIEKAASKALITILVYGEDAGAKVDLKAEFDPDIKDSLPHLAADIALEMINSVFPTEVPNEIGSRNEEETDETAVGELAETKDDEDGTG